MVRLEVYIYMRRRVNSGLRRGGTKMANARHRILDTETGTQYAAKAAAGRDLAYLVNGDPKDQFVWFKIARAYPERFRVLNGEDEWVRLDDPSAPVGTLRA